MKFIIGKKIEMTQAWQGDRVLAITRVKAGPCLVTQVRNNEKDGYQAVQLSFGEKREKNINKPQRGHMKKAQKNIGTKINPRYLREFRIEGDEIKAEPGNIIDITSFEPGDKIQVTGISKGKGFQGVVKRHGFSGSKKTHGNKDQLRMPGSIGATGPAHVFKGQRMPGRMGGDRTTIKNLEIIEIDKENNIISVKGAIPGARNGLLLLQGEGELKLVISNTPKEKPKVTEEMKEDFSTNSEQEKVKDENIEEVVVEAKEKQEGKKEKTKQGEKK